MRASNLKIMTYKSGGLDLKTSILIFEKQPRSAKKSSVSEKLPPDRKKLDLDLKKQLSSLKSLPKS